MTRFREARLQFRASPIASIFLAVALIAIGFIAYFDVAGVSVVRKRPPGIVLAVMAWALGALVVWLAFSPKAGNTKHDD